MHVCVCVCGGGGGGDRNPTGSMKTMLRHLHPVSVLNKFTQPHQPHFHLVHAMTSHDPCFFVDFFYLEV